MTNGWQSRQGADREMLDVKVITEQFESRGGSKLARSRGLGCSKKDTDRDNTGPVWGSGWRWRVLSVTVEKLYVSFCSCVQTSVMQVNGEGMGDCSKSDPPEIGCCPRSLALTLLTCNTDLVPSAMQWKVTLISSPALGRVTLHLKKRKKNNKKKIQWLIWDVCLLTVMCP